MCNKSDLWWRTGVQRYTVEVSWNSNKTNETVLPRKMQCLTGLLITVPIITITFHSLRLIILSLKTSGFTRTSSHAMWGSNSLFSRQAGRQKAARLKGNQILTKTRWLLNIFETTPLKDTFTTQSVPPPSISSQFNVLFLPYWKFTAEVWETRCMPNLWPHNLKQTAVCSMACAGEEQLCLALSSVYFTQLTISRWTDMGLPDKFFRTTYSNSLTITRRLIRRWKRGMCFTVRFTSISNLPPRHSGVVFYTHPVSFSLLFISANHRTTDDFYHQSAWLNTLFLRLSAFK